VAAGIAHFVGSEPRAVRWLLVLTTLLSLGIGALIYALLWLLLPANDSGTSH
jgi:phage shock protein PspC (stress-responsive transcriptional regulator)